MTIALASNVGCFHDTRPLPGDVYDGGEHVAVGELANLDDTGAAMDTVDEGDRSDVPSNDVPDVPDSDEGVSVRVQEIVAGWRHTCARTVDGGVYCWGYNDDGQLGDDIEGGHPLPTRVRDVPVVMELAAGERYTCARTDDGRVWCWGPGGSQPAERNDLRSVLDIAAGAAHACALLQGGTVRCWGANGSGQLGIGTLDGGTVQGLQNVVQIVAGAEHTCALLDGGAVRCWGANDNQQLGGAVPDGGAPIASVVGLADAVQIAAGANHTCAILDGGAVWCWGANDSRQLGNGTALNSAPGSVQGLRSVIGLALGEAHSCALLDGGTVQCWGRNSDGQLGDGTSAETRSTPTAVGELHDVEGLAAGAAHTCAWLRDGTAYCWGRARDGQLGSAGALECSPVRVAGLPDAGRVESLAAGGTTDTSGDFLRLGGRTCAVTADGQVYCWGAGLENAPPRSVPERVTGLSRQAEVSLGDGHACALERDGGAVRCWGNNNQGQRGGNPSMDYAPPGNSVIGGATHIDLGAQHSCAVVDGGLQCWGSNDGEQLGVARDGGLDGSHTPVPVQGVEGTLTGVAAGGAHTCVRNVAGAVYCWGNTVAVRDMRPHRVPGLTEGIAQITAGGMHTCALRDGGTVQCWGRGREGQLGHDIRLDSTDPVGVPGLSSVQQVVAGTSHTCVRRSDGRASCWGANNYGQLGDGTLDDRATPTEVPGLEGVTLLAAGEDHTCAVTVGGVRCWGRATHGQLGHGTRPWVRERPARVVFGGCPPTGTVASGAP